MLRPGLSPSRLDLVEDEAFVLVKAAPRRSQTHGETVCCAGVDLEGRWVRLYPVSFRELADANRFARWDRIRYRGARPAANRDRRDESRRIDHKSVEIVGSLTPRHRPALLNRIAVTSLRREHEEGRSLALLRVEVLEYWSERRPASEVEAEDATLDVLRRQADLFAASSAIPAAAIPFAFKYRYRDDDGEHVGTCQDWETQQTFLARRRDLGSEDAALAWMQRKFGEEYPQRGMALAMGTHRVRGEQWLVNGVIRMDKEPQLALL